MWVQRRKEWRWRIPGDRAHFVRSLVTAPRLMGAVAPSGRPLARAMAKAVGNVRGGLVVELGPGTGPVTRALVEEGLNPNSLVLVEYDSRFCRMLKSRFEPARVRFARLSRFSTASRLIISAAATSPMLKPQRTCRMSATCAASGRRGWQQVNIMRSRSSLIASAQKNSSTTASSVANRAAWSPR